MICLPVTAMWWYPETVDSGPARVVAPEGTPVHAVASGRITTVDALTVGTIVVRDHAERFHHYRRLQASSIRLEEGAEVECGDIIGVVASPSDGSTPALLYGVHDNENRWLDAVGLLTGAMDPADLLLQPVPVDANDPLVRRARASASAPSTTAPRAKRDGAPTREQRDDTPAAGRQAPTPPPTPSQAPAVDEMSAPVDPERPEPDRAAEPPRSRVPEPAAEPEPEPEPAPKRSRLAARRPPKRSS